MNIWNEDLMCFWLKIEPKNETTISIYLPEGSCADMSGAIKTAKNLMPKVAKILVFADAEQDAIYELKNAKWSAVG